MVQGQKTSSTFLVCLIINQEMIVLLWNESYGVSAKICTGGFDDFHP